MPPRRRSTVAFDKVDVILLVSNRLMKTVAAPDSLPGFAARWAAHGAAAVELAAQMDADAASRGTLRRSYAAALVDRYGQPPPQRAPSPPR